MSNYHYKQLYITYKNGHGSLHYKTLYYHCRYHLHFILIMWLFVLIQTIKWMGVSIKHSLNKYRICRSVKKFINTHRNKKISTFIKPIALYLPQFHTIAENDLWWGKGFTEWTNTKKAKPLFEGHYQPHIPHKDIGYYDLSDVNVMRKQAKMAKEYGLYGFCFYYYHFANGKRLLEKPINNYLQATDIDFPFCFAWANENWTRAWDGGNKEVIMPQDYDENNMLQMLKEMLPAFQDKRYIKIDNKPLLLVYRAEIIPAIKELTQKWRSLIKKSGFSDLYLISMQNFKEENPNNMGFDAAVEFAPRKETIFLSAFKDPSPYNHQKTNIEYIHLKDIIKAMSFRDRTPYPRLKCICPSWDNSPRRGENGSRILLGTDKDRFEMFFKNAIKETLANNRPADGLLFINAWNEWGEGAHLEPDEKYGYDYLNTIKNIQNSTLEKLN